MRPWPTRSLSLAALVVAVGLLTAGAADARVVSADAGHLLIEHATMLNAPPDAAFRTLTQDVAQWWDPAHTFFGSAANLSIETRAGGCFCERTDDGRQAEHFRVVFVDAARGLKLSGAMGPVQDMGVSGTLRMQWMLMQDGRTKMIWRYRVAGEVEGDAAKMAAAIDTVLGEQLARYQAAVEQGTKKVRRPITERRPPRKPDLRKTAPVPRPRRR